LSKCGRGFTTLRIGFHSVVNQDMPAGNKNMAANEDSPRRLAFGVVILAAGSSSRMGRPKLLLPWAATTVLGHLIGQWTKAGARQIAVVCVPDARPIRGELDRLGFPESNRVVNPSPERGMFSSIRCAANWPGWEPDLTHWVITLGDQPHLREATLRALLDFAAAQPGNICQPLRHGHRRHPVVLPGPAFAALKDTPAADLKRFLQSRANALAGFDAEDAGLDFDMDEPADYERARQLYFNGA
jgi:molybdenum cofactor cytidylyltransferase